MNFTKRLLTTIPLTAAAFALGQSAQAGDYGTCSTTKTTAEACSMKESCPVTDASVMKVVNAAEKSESFCPASKSAEIASTSTVGSENKLEIINVDYKAQGDQKTLEVVSEKKGSYDLGDKIVPFSALHAQSGETKSLSDVAGSKATVVIFWNQNCPYVEGANGAADSIEAFASKYKDQGVSVIAIDAGANNSPATIKEYSKSRTFPIMINDDSTLAAKFNATYTPNTFILDADMKLVYKGAFYTGTGDSRVMHAENATKEIIAGNAPTVTSTKGVGCSIKWAGGKKPTI
ncbi:MAG: redoxin domain-containing protein [Sumerlaeia bacterium]